MCRLLNISVKTVLGTVPGRRVLLNVEMPFLPRLFIKCDLIKMILGKQNWLGQDMPRTISIPFMVLCLISLFLGIHLETHQWRTTMLLGTLFWTAPLIMSRNIYHFFTQHALRSFMPSLLNKLSVLSPRKPGDRVNYLIRATMFSIGRIVFVLDKPKLLPRSPVLFLSDKVRHL